MSSVSGQNAQVDLLKLVSTSATSHDEFESLGGGTDDIDDDPFGSGDDGGDFFGTGVDDDGSLGQEGADGMESLVGVGDDPDSLSLDFIVGAAAGKEAAREAQKKQEEAMEREAERLRQLAIEKEKLRREQVAKETAAAEEKRQREEKEKKEAAERAALVNQQKQHQQQQLANQQQQVTTNLLLGAPAIPTTSSHLVSTVSTGGEPNTPSSSQVSSSGNMVVSSTTNLRQNNIITSNGVTTTKMEMSKKRPAASQQHHQQQDGLGHPSSNGPLVKKPRYDSVNNPTGNNVTTSTTINSAAASNIVQSRQEKDSGTIKPISSTQQQPLINNTTSSVVLPHAGVPATTVTKGQYQGITTKQGTVVMNKQQSEANTIIANSLPNGGIQTSSTMLPLPYSSSTAVITQSSVNIQRGKVGNVEKGGGANSSRLVTTTTTKDRSRDMAFERVRAEAEAIAALATAASNVVDTKKTVPMVQQVNALGGQNMASNNSVNTIVSSSYNHLMTSYQSRIAKESLPLPTQQGTVVDSAMKLLKEKKSATHLQQQQLVKAVGGVPGTKVTNDVNVNMIRVIRRPAGEMKGHNNSVMIASNNTSLKKGNNNVAVKYAASQGNLPVTAGLSGRLVASNVATTVGDKMNTSNGNTVSTTTAPTGTTVIISPVCSGTSTPGSVSSVSSTITTKKKREKKVHKCLICGKIFSRKHDFTRHMSVHKGEKKYKCPRCPKKFNRKYNLTVHLRTHTGEKPYKCYCGRAFTCKSTLITHQRTHGVSDKASALSNGNNRTNNRNKNVFPSTITPIPSTSTSSPTVKTGTNSLQSGNNLSSQSTSSSTARPVVAATEFLAKTSTKVPTTVIPPQPAPPSTLLPSVSLLAKPLAVPLGTNPINPAATNRVIVAASTQKKE
eukprot:g2537.t1